MEARMMLSKQIFVILLPLVLFLGNKNLAFKEETLYFGAKSNGVLCGYSEVHISQAEKDGKNIILLEENGEVKLTALSAPVHTKFKYCFHIDSKTGQFFYYESIYTQKNMITGMSIEIQGNKATVTWKPQGKKNIIDLPQDIILSNYQIYPHLVRDFVKTREDKKSYKAIDLMDGKIYDLTYTKLGTEQLELNDKTYNAIVLDELNLSTGQKSKFWIDINNGYRLKMDFPNRTIFLAEKSIRNRIKSVNIDHNMVAKVNLIIPDVKSISFMKVKAQLQPRGLWVTPDSLNIPGQVFKGTVKKNLVNGIFEVSYKKYEGENAPAFPPDFKKDPSLRKYLKPDDLIESDDPVLMKKAQKLTKGAANSWQALKLLSKWVAEEIVYDIPGGMSARNTYDIKRGKCDAYSFLLAAFCRAVGIPARIIWGCMYFPHFGGGFVQHAWNEVYMGNAGWIPIDTTAGEIDFVDSGHIRIGNLKSKTSAFNPKKMEILEYKPNPHKPIASEMITLPKKYEPLVGNYRSSIGPYKGKILRVMYKKPGLAIEIPKRGILDLMEPDKNGLFFFKVTKQASVSFQKDEAGEVSGLNLWIRTRLPKKNEPEVVSDAVPKKFRPYLGKYPVPMESFELTIIFRDGNLAIVESNGDIVELKGPDEKGLWIYKSTGYKISFIFGDKDQVKAMVVHQIYKIPKMGINREGKQDSKKKEQER
jgi:hypothetical protein